LRDSVVFLDRKHAVTLAELLENRFRGDIRYRGDAYLKAERVAITHVSEESVFGSVRDGAEYHTQLVRSNGDLKLACSCAEETGRKVPCKHLWATVLAADSGGYVSPALRPGNVPPFVVAEPDAGFSLYDDEDDSAGPGFVPRKARRRLEHDEPEPLPRKGWEGSLSDLRRKLEEGIATDTGERLDREIIYEIDRKRSRDTRKLVVQVSQRQRRADGRWGARKILRIRPDRLDEIENDEDRRILAFLAGATPDSVAGSRGGSAPGAHHRFQLPYELCTLVLPPMCATGRVIYDDERVSSPLAWDDGEPWQLTLRMSAADEVEVGCVKALRGRTDLDERQPSKHGASAQSLDTPYVLEGRLVRGDEQLAVTESEMLLPGGLVGWGNRIGRLDDFDAFAWVPLIEDAGEFTIPAADAEDFIDRVLDMPTLPKLDLPEHLRLEEVIAEPVPYLFVKTPPLGKRRRWQPDRLTASVQFDYQGTMVPASSSRWAIVQREQGRCLMRNRGREEQLWSDLQDCGVRRLRDHRRGNSDCDIHIRDLGSAVRQLIQRGWEVRADGKPVRQPGAMKFRIRSDVDWFDLDADVEFGGGGTGIAFPELLSALARGDTTVRLDDGSLGVLPEDWIQRYGLLAGLAEIDGDQVRMARNQAVLLDALLSAQESVDYDRQFLELRQRLHDFAGIAEAEEPEGFHGTLRHYQKEGLGWLEFLREFRFGGCLADDMGLGKTVQFLALLVDRQQNRKKKQPSLVVVPKSLIFNWHQESTRFAPGLKVLEYAGSDRGALRQKFGKYDLILTTYGTVRRDALELKDIPFDYVVLDEAQTIKNAGSQVAKASRLLQANHRLALSGTPIENHLGDLWSIFEFLNPGMLGRSSVFRSITAEIEDDNSRELLSRALRPFILRRTKAQVAGELPSKFEQTIHCDMGGKQRRLYEELKEHYRQSLLGLVADQGLSKSKMHVLEALLRLRQAACHPGLLDPSKIDDPSAKLDVLVPDLEELLDEGHKSLVFSQFTSMLSIVRKRLDERHIDYEYLDGQTRDRKAPVERFQTDPACGVFLISLKAGGLGLNLTAADYVFLLDPWWNPAVETQAIDRAHRVGQTRNVFAYRLICRNTVEEKIALLQEKKRSLAEAILEADSNLLKELTTEDLEMLLS
jgi:superfamily II DNA or RNA helicase